MSPPAHIPGCKPSGDRLPDDHHSREARTGIVLTCGDTGTRSIFSELTCISRLTADFAPEAVGAGVAAARVPGTLAEVIVTYRVLNERGAGHDDRRAAVTGVLAQAGSDVRPVLAVPPGQTARKYRPALVVTDATGPSALRAPPGPE
jgi:hypothetical protein